MKNNKGFTLIELLAALTILGIMMIVAIPNVQKFIDRSKEDNLDANAKMLYMAAKSYYQTNPQELPKVDHGTVTITSAVLKQRNFLKDSLKNGNKHSCTNVSDQSKDSRVTVEKTGKSKYSYHVEIICNADGNVDKDATY